MTIFSDSSRLQSIHEMSPSCNFLQPSPFTSQQFLTTPPPTVTVNAHNDNNSRISSEEFIKKRPLLLTEDLVAGRPSSHSSRSRCRPPPTTTSPKRLAIQELPRLYASSDSSTMDINSVTPPSKYPYRIPARAHDMPSQPCSAELVCYSRVRRHAKKTRSPKSRRSCTPSSSTKSPLYSAHALRDRSPLIRWTPPSASTGGFYTPGSTHYPITPTSNAASVLVATSCPWTISSSSSSPYSPHFH